MTVSHDPAFAQQVQDRIELLRLRTLLVGALGMIGLVAGGTVVVAATGHVLKLAWQVLASDSGRIHVPANLFQVPADGTWARSPALLQLAFAVIGLAGIVQITRQAISVVQVRVWCGVLLCLAAAMAYFQFDLGSLWQAPQRQLMKAVKAQEWDRVEQLSSASHNLAGHAYVMAQIGLVKHDRALLLAHGKPLVDRIDNLLLQRGAEDTQLLAAADGFSPQVLRDIDVAVYGAPHTEIGLRLAAAGPNAGPSSAGRALAWELLWLCAATVLLIAAGASLRLWRGMTRRLHDLRIWHAGMA
jgi:hypothetical protein